MKETLLERLQRESRENYKEELVRDNDGLWVTVNNLEDLIANTLKQASEELRQETMRKVMSKLRKQFDSEDDELSLEEIEVALYELDEETLTDAQRLLGVDKQ